METYEVHEFRKGMLDKQPEAYRYDIDLFRELAAVSEAEAVASAAKPSPPTQLKKPKNLGRAKVRGKAKG